MDQRLHESPYCKSSSSLPHRDREESRDKRPTEGPIKHFTRDERQPFRSMRSPPRARVTSSFRPRLGGRFYRPRFIRDDHTFRKPHLSSGFQRFNSFSPRPRFNWRDQSGSTGPENHYQNQRNVETNSPNGGPTSKQHTGAVKYSARLSRKMEKQPVSFKVMDRPHSREEDMERPHSKGEDGERPHSRGEDGERPHSRGEDRERPHSRGEDGERPQSRGEDGERDGEIPGIVSRAAIRNRAIQQKRKEIERVYRQDCDTFGVVVKMLIAKDLSLEPHIQSSLQENLRDIGLRCVEAMQQFIEEYDSREPST